MKKIWIMVTMLVAAAVLMAGCAGLPANQVSNTNNSNGTSNFSLLISDEANDIDDFVSLNVTISSIGLHRSGEDGDWEEITIDPPAKVDLVNLPGLVAQKIFVGNIVSGNYTKVFINVDKVEGALKEDVAAEVGEFSIKLPGGKFQISKNFEITQGQITNFVFDITAIRTGNGKYILKPQISESGADKEFKEVTAQGKPEDKIKSESMGKSENTGRPEGAGKPEKTSKPETEVEENDQES